MNPKPATLSVTRRAAALMPRALLPWLLVNLVFVSTSLAQDTIAVEREPDAASADDRHRLSAGYEFEYLGEGADPWHFVSLGYTRGTEAGSFSGGVNYMRRFGDVDGLQLVASAYPDLGGDTYGYAEAAVRAAGDLFIGLRAAAEVFHNFPNAWEGSVGLRYYDRTEEPDLVSYTGTVGKYVGNYWISLRPTFTPREDDLSRSVQLWTRRYFSGRHDYVGLRVNAGTGPDEDDDVSRLSNPDLSSYSVTLSRKQPIGPDSWRVEYGVGYERDEYRTDSVTGQAVARSHLVLQLGIERYFR